MKSQLPALVWMLIFVANEVAAGPDAAATPSIAADAAVAAEERDPWSVFASVSGYAIPDGPDYLSPLVTADKGWLHLEGRYSYEALDAASVWIGWNMGFERRWAVEFTPMVGGVFGKAEGFAAGWRLSLSRGAFELTSEAEWMMHSDRSEEDFFYAWTEATWSFSDSFWAGLALQRTRAYETDLDVQPGLLVGTTFRNLEISAYVFNLGWEDPVYVITVGRKF